MPYTDTGRMTQYFKKLCNQNPNPSHAHKIIICANADHLGIPADHDPPGEESPAELAVYTAEIKRTQILRELDFQEVEGEYGELRITTDPGHRTTVVVECESSYHPWKKTGHPSRAHSCDDYVAVYWAPEATLEEVIEVERIANLIRNRNIFDKDPDEVHFEVK